MLQLNFRKVSDDQQVAGQPTLFAFFDKDGNKRGPIMSDRVTAHAFVIRLHKMDEVSNSNADLLVQQVAQEFDAIRAATGTEPTVKLKFVPSASRTNGVFLIDNADDKVGPTMKNGAAATNFVDQLIMSGDITAKNGADLKKQVSSVFAEIYMVGPGQPIEFNLVRTHSGDGAIIINATTGRPTTNKIFSKKRVLTMIAKGEAENQINAATADSIRKQADEVFDQLDAAQQNLRMIKTIGGAAVVVMEGDDKLTHALRTMGFVHLALSQMHYLTDTTRDRLVTEATSLFAEIEEEARKVVSRYNFVLEPNQDYGYVKNLDGNPVSPVLADGTLAKMFVQDMASGGLASALEAYLLQNQIETAFGPPQDQPVPSGHDPIVELMQLLGLEGHVDVVVIPL